MLAANDYAAPDDAVVGRDAPQLQALITQAVDLLAQKTTARGARGFLRQLISALVAADEAQGYREPGKEAARIASAIAAQYGLTLEDMQSDKTGRHYTIPRQAVMHALVGEGIYSLCGIGRFLNRDHSTVGHGVRAHERRAGL